MRRGLKFLLLSCLDFLFSLDKQTASLPDCAERILICNMSSFGDVVISTALLPPLKQRYPNSEIGFLLSAQTEEVLKRHPMVARLHSFNHWYAVKEKKWWKAFFQHARGTAQMIKEIRGCKYDLAIDLCPIFGISVLPILWKAKIPLRIGYEIKGYPNLWTHSLFLQADFQYMGRVHLNLLKILGIEPGRYSCLPSYKAEASFDALAAKNYIVVHMGSSYLLKQWDRQKWKEVVQRLIASGKTVVLTGKGSREEQECDYIFHETGCLNYCGRLSWSEFTAVIQQAQSVVSVDSVAVHIAAAVQVPCLILFAGISSMALWKPPYFSARVLIKDVPCAPCLNWSGCKEMSCIQGIQVDEVIDTLRGLR